MASEYSAIAAQTIAVDSNVIFENGCRSCRKGFITHRDDSGLFYLKGSNSCNKAVYRVSFGGNIAIATGGTVEPISIALTINGEELQNTIRTVTPAAIGDVFAVNSDTFVDVPCGCCVTVSVENASATTAITVTNANIIFERVA